MASTDIFCHEEYYFKYSYKECYRYTREITREQSGRRSPCNVTFSNTVATCNMI